MQASGLHRFAVLTAGATLFLIFAGGMVTSTGSGLAVPDWPLSYGQLMPEMVGGIFYEHGHRMVAATVGLLTVVLACWIFLREPRRWVGRLAACALGVVVVQGMLGGLTVLLLLPPAVSIIHACLAQAFFCLTVTLAVVTGPIWSGQAERAVADDGHLRSLSVVLVSAVYLQLILGAAMRHTNAGLAIPDFPLALGRLVPPVVVLRTDPKVAIHFSHRVMAAVVTVAAGWLICRIIGGHRARTTLMRPAILLAALLAIQVTLGGMTVLTGKSPIPTTFHVACGAAVLATALVLALRTHRLAAAPA